MNDSNINIYKLKEKETIKKKLSHIYIMYRISMIKKFKL